MKKKIWIQCKLQDLNGASSGFLKVIVCEPFHSLREKSNTDMFVGLGKIDRNKQFFFSQMDAYTNFKNLVQNEIRNGS